jgi:hypothetical protein
MRSNPFLKVLWGGILLLIISGCSTFTKMRYSKGFKTNIELFGKTNEPTTVPILPRKAVKKNSPNSKVPAIAKSDYQDSILYHPFRGTIMNGDQSNIVQTRKNKPFMKNIISLTKDIQDKQPIEPTIAQGATMFYGGIVLSYVTAFLANLLALPGIILLLPLILILLGFIFCIVGLKRYNSAPDQYRGEGLAISVIVLFILSVLGTLALIALIAIILL